MLSRPLPAALLAALVLPATAHGAPVVVTTAPDGARLAVEDAPQAPDLAQRAPAAVDRLGYTTPYAFCLQVQPPGARAGGGCDQVALPTTDDPVVSSVDATPDAEWMGGAVPESAASVELQFHRAAPLRVRTVPGAYQGAYAGRVRFFLAAVPDAPLRTRVFDATGREIGGDGLEATRGAGRSVRVAGGGLRGGGRWESSARVEQVPVPAAGAPERREGAACLTIRVTARDRSSLIVSGCRDRRRLPAGSLLRAPDCGARRTALAALLPPGVRRAVLVLGDGSRLAMRSRALPARFGARQYAVAAVVPAGAAVRALRAGGHVRRLGLAPATVACDLGATASGPLSRSGIPGPFSSDAADLFGPPQTPVPGARTVVGGLTAALRGDDVCAGLGGPPRSPDGCAPAPLRARQTRVAGHGREIGLVTAPTVTSVQLLDAATQRPVASAPTVPLGGGRAAALTAPAGRRVLVARLLGADGHPIADVGLAPIALARPRVIARGRGWVASATPILEPSADTLGVLPLSTTCTRVTGRLPRTLSGACLDDASGLVRLSVTCAPRLVHVFGAGNGATLVLAGGRRRAATARHGAWHGVLRGREALRAVRLAGRTRALAVPSAAVQCGYTAFG